MVLTGSSSIGYQKNSHVIALSNSFQNPLPPSSLIISWRSEFFERLHIYDYIVRTEHILPCDCSTEYERSPHLKWLTHQFLTHRRIAYHLYSPDISEWRADTKYGSISGLYTSWQHTHFRSRYTSLHVSPYAFVRRYQTSHMSISTLYGSCHMEDTSS